MSNIIFGNIISFIAITVSICSFFPEIYKMYKNKSNKNISIIMIICSIMAYFLWLIYYSLKGGLMTIEIIYYIILIILTSIMLYTYLKFNNHKKLGEKSKISL